MSKCWWCHKPDHLYAFNLCHACYRWFYRHPYLNHSDYCTLCNKFITKRNKGICKECNAALKISGHIPKRVENLERKFEDLKPHLSQFNTKDSAFLALRTAFKHKQHKYLEALLERFYDQVTLQTIADQWGTSREYVRQCENKAIKIVTELFSD